MTFTPEHILITGAAGAIGGELARVFAEQMPRARLSLVDLDGDALQERCRALGDGAEPAVCDLTAIESLPQWWRGMVEARGEVDLLINCAGIMDIVSFAGTGWERGRRSLDINMTAPLRLMDLALPSMIDAGRGAVINISSMAGQVPLRGCAYYGGAKAGLAHASEIARTELREQGVDVITVYPGPVWSGLESRARAQVKPGMLSRYIPTGRADVLAQRIYRALRHRQARVIYPGLYGSANQVSSLGLVRRLIERFSPRPLD